MYMYIVQYSDRLSDTSQFTPLPSEIQKAAAQRLNVRWSQGFIRTKSNLKNWHGGIPLQPPYIMREPWYAERKQTAERTYV